LSCQVHSIDGLDPTYPGVGLVPYLYRRNQMI
jgi:hypothetical protein